MHLFRRLESALWQISPPALRRHPLVNLRFLMYLFPPTTKLKNFSAVFIGKYSVFPTIHETTSGSYLGAVTVSSGQGSASHHRMFRFSRRHATVEAAQLVALTQGWLQTCNPRPVMC